MSNNEIIRVIGCQGSIQFMTAINVLRTHKEDGVRKNYLLVYELYAPNGQDADFFLFIKKMAEVGVIPFEKIIYINPAVVKELTQVFMEKGLHPLVEKVLGIIGVNRVDELYLSTNWQPVNKLLINCFAKSYKVCYGDSMGLHIPEYYFADQNIATKIRQLNVVRSLKRTYEQLRFALKFPGRDPVFGGLHEIKFDTGYYLTTGLAKKKPDWNYSYTQKSSLLDTFCKYIDLFSFDIGSDFTNNSKSNAVLMTTNFSEAQRMSQENELKAYLEFIRQHLQKGASLIIKPHPRDSKSKLGQLEELLSANGYNVRILDDINFYFIPFELLLLKMKSKYPTERNAVRYFTFSSSCLSIRWLFDEDPSVGMGDALVKKYFNPSQQTSRIKHENDLRRLLTTRIAE